VARDDEWFRSDAWDDRAQRLFEERLAGTRAARAQFLRLKALALVETGDPVRVAAGRELLDRLLNDHPENVLEVAGAHRILAESYVREHRLGSAECHLTRWSGA
jgi:hypothetical protein